MYIYIYICIHGASQVALVVKNLPANVGDIRDTGLIPKFERYPGEGNGNPLQYFCVENSMDKGAWQAVVHMVTKSWIQLKLLSMHACTYVYIYNIYTFLNCLIITCMFCLPKPQKCASVLSVLFSR